MSLAMKQGGTAYSSVWFRANDQTPAESLMYLGCYSICEEMIQVIG
jgi:hypothetical protein